MYIKKSDRPLKYPEALLNAYSRLSWTLLCLFSCQVGLVIGMKISIKIWSYHAAVMITSA